jgi:hypothetical protein
MSVSHQPNVDCFNCHSNNVKSNGISADATKKPKTPLLEYAHGRSHGKAMSLPHQPNVDSNTPALLYAYKETLQGGTSLEGSLSLVMGAL